MNLLHENKDNWGKRGRKKIYKENDAHILLAFSCSTKLRRMSVMRPTMSTPWFCLIFLFFAAAEKLYFFFRCCLLFPFGVVALLRDRFKRKECSSALMSVFCSQFLLILHIFYLYLLLGVCLCVYFVFTKLSFISSNLHKNITFQIINNSPKWKWPISMGALCKQRDRCMGWCERTNNI